MHYDVKFMFLSAMLASYQVKSSGNVDILLVLSWRSSRPSPIEGNERALSLSYRRLKAVKAHDTSSYSGSANDLKKLSYGDGTLATARYK